MTFRPFPISNPVATCAYKQFKPDMGVLIGTSTGNNRQIAGIKYVKALAPWSTFRKIDDPAEAEPVYQAQLTRDIEKIEAQLISTASLFPATGAQSRPRFVFACFEDLSVRGSFCHRTWLARWLTDTYGLDVPELGKTREPVRAASDTLV